jgi:hypothetical protein
MSPSLLKNGSKHGPFLESFQNIVPLLESNRPCNGSSNPTNGKERCIPAIMRRPKKCNTTSSIFDSRIFFVVVGIEQRLLNEEPTEAVTQKDYGSVLVIPFDPNSFQKFGCFIDEGTLIRPVDNSRIVFVKEDASIWAGSW